jgi:hypothetical protein
VKTTVSGVATKVGEIAVEQKHYAVTGAHSYRSLTLELPPGGIAIDCDHDHQAVGELIYAELGEDDRLRCVAVLDNDQLTKLDQDVYWSPELDLRGGDPGRYFIARTASLIGLSVTFNPATLAAQPIEIRAGDLRSRVDSGKWATSWRSTSPLLARALDHLANDRGVETRTATRIIDEGARRAAERDRVEWERDRHLIESRQPRSDLRRVPPQFRPGWKPGMIEWSQAGGRVLRVS